MRLSFFVRRLHLLFKLKKKQVSDASVASDVRIQKGVHIDIGKRCRTLRLAGNVRIRRLTEIEIGGALIVGKDTVIGSSSFIQADGHVEIGAGVLMGPQVKIFSTSHAYGRTGELRQPLIKGSVVIGKNVWIGAGAVIAFNTTIGDNSVIGANAFVSGDIPGNCVAAGCPARVVKSF